MSGIKRYINICSAYRNRNLYPNPAEFEISSTPRNVNITPTNAYDVLISSYPIMHFGSFGIGGINTLMIGGDGKNPVLNNITAYGDNYLNASAGIYQFTNVSGERCYIRVIIDKNIQRLSQITPEEVINRDWMTTPYVPNPFFNISENVNGNNVAIRNGSINTGAYVNYYAEVQDSSNACFISKITYYNGSYKVATTENTIFNIDDNYRIIRPNYPLIWNESLISSGTYVYNSVSYFYVQLSATSSNTLDYYVNYYFFDKTKYVANTTPNYSLIVKYFPTPPPLSGLPNNVALLSTPLVVNNLDLYDILSFSGDNYTPLNYVGSFLEENNCFNLTLTSLILPNVYLDTFGIGGRAVNVPYVYVELEMRSVSEFLISSNNPNARHALFYVSLDDYPSLLDSPFVRVSGNFPTQKIKFNPRDNFKIRIILPNGSTFNSTTDDNLSPLYPNNDLQVSVLFSFEKMYSNVGELSTNLSKNIRLMNIDSTYRNRRDFPNPADFDITTTPLQTTSTIYNAIAPISNDFPISLFNEKWNSSASTFTENTQNIIINNTTYSIFCDTRGCLLAYIDNNLAVPILKTFYSLVKSNDILSSLLTANPAGYTYNVNLRAQITPFFPTEIAKILDAVGVQINTTTLSLPSYADYSHILLFDNNNWGENALVDYYLDPHSLWFNSMVNRSPKKIIKYDNDKNLLQLASNITALGAGLINDTFVVRKEQAYNKGYVLGGTTNTAILNNGGTITNEYVGMYFVVYELMDQCLTGKIITAYNANTRTITFYPSFNTSMEYYYYTPPVVIAQYYLSYSICRFSYDNFCPMVIPESLISRSEISCYEISLLSLVLPNVPLDTYGIGGYVINLPYIYVDFYNRNGNTYSSIVTSSSLVSHSLFLVSITDYPKIADSPFVRINNIKERQTIKFQYGDTLHFTIRLPNGGVLEMTQSDVYPHPFGWTNANYYNQNGSVINPNFNNWATWSIAPPDPSYQISAVFTIKRVE